MFFLLVFLDIKEYFKHGLLTTLITLSGKKNFIPDCYFFNYE